MFIFKRGFYTGGWKRETGEIFEYLRLRVRWRDSKENRLFSRESRRLRLLPGPDLKVADYLFRYRRTDYNPHSLTHPVRGKGRRKGGVWRGKIWWWLINNLCVATEKKEKVYNFYHRRGSDTGTHCNTSSPGDIRLLLVFRHFPFFCFTFVKKVNEIGWR